MNTNKILVALLKWDLVGWTETSRRLGEEKARKYLGQIHDALEFSLTGQSPDTDSFSFEGDGGKAYFSGKDAVERAVRAGLDAIERVRTLPEIEVRLRVSVGSAAVSPGSDLTRVTPHDFNLAGHMVGGDVCPPNALCVTEDSYYALGPTELVGSFSHLGTTARDDAPVFVTPSGRKPAKEGGLVPAEKDPYRIWLNLHRYYANPPFSLLRFYALPKLKIGDSVELERAFTPLRVRKWEKKTFHLEALQTIKLKTSSLPPHLAEPLAAPPEDFQGVFAQQRSLVVLGDPGSGKTTLLRYLALVTSGGRAKTLEKLGANERLFPVYTTAADLLFLKRKNPKASLCHLFASLLGTHVNSSSIDTEAIAQAFEDTAESGRILFLVDGLDEFPDPKDREFVAEFVEETAHRFTKCRFVVTSRIIGYPGVRLPSGETYALAPLQPEHARSLAETFYVEIFRSQRYGEEKARQEGVKKGDALVAALERRQSLNLFARNPLLLTLAALVHVQLGELPRYRVKLYDVAAQTLIEAWAKARHPVQDAGDIYPVDYENEGRVILTFLAYHIHMNCPGGLISADEIEKLLQGKLRPKGTSVSGFLRKLQEAGALFAEKGPGQWGFVHQTFQEYLAAKYVAAEDLQEDLLKKLYDPQWEEVICVAAAEMSIIRGRDKAASEFIKKIFEDERSWEGTVLKKNKILAARCLAETLCSDAELENKALKTLEAMCEEYPPPPWGAIEATFGQISGTPLAISLVRELLGPLGNMKSKRGTKIRALAALDAREAIPQLMGLLRDGDPWVRGEAAEALGLLGAGEAIPQLMDLLSDKDWKERWSAAKALGLLGARETIPQLMNLLSDEDSSVQGSAAEALGLLGAGEAIPQLMELLRDEDSLERGSVAEALWEISSRNYDNRRKEISDNLRRSAAE
ncbi:MAG: HEAT repeat domain-containing protein [Armatimonadetes bacterium]|nr:HEAT repeat domain-containing protein [Armatimonadota bacterium]